MRHEGSAAEKMFLQTSSATWVENGREHTEEEPKANGEWTEALTLVIRASWTSRNEPVDAWWGGPEDVGALVCPVRGACGGPVESCPTPRGHTRSHL